MTVHWSTYLIKSGLVVSFRHSWQMLMGCCFCHRRYQHAAEIKLKRLLDWAASVELKGNGANPWQGASNRAHYGIC
jgi:hypothetical protein